MAESPSGPPAASRTWTSIDAARVAFAASASPRASASLDIVMELRETGSMGWKPGCLIVALLAAFSAPGARADDFMSLEQSIALGRFTLELRPRYNEITESEYPLKTEGGTIRMVAGYRTGAWRGWRANVELIHTDRIGPQHFNDNGADFGTSPYPLLPDPSYTGPNQVNVEYASDGGLRLRLGRQRVRFGNQRWVSDN